MESLQRRIHREQRAVNNNTGEIVNLTFVEADGAQTRTIVPGEKAFYVSSGHASNTLTLTLPRVNEATGQFIYVKALTGATATTTLEDNNGDAAFADKTLDADNDNILVYSTGKEWLVVVNGIA